jgi:glycosyltransferase involved in cell wall biosynthesis
MAVLNPHPVYFPQAVQSVMQQTLEDLELVIVEEPSPRSTRELLVGLSDPRIRHQLDLQRTSVGAQRNRGLAHARADLVALLDADDICEPDRVEKQLDYLRAHPETDVLGSQLCIINAEGRQIGYRAYPLDHHSILRAMRRFDPIGNPSVVFKKALVLEAGGYQFGGSSADDYELWCRLAVSGARFANHRESLVRYRIHPESMKSTRVRHLLRDTLEIKRMYWHGQMDLRERARIWGERILLCLPPKLVLRLFMKTQYRDRLPCYHYDSRVVTEE